MRKFVFIYITALLMLLCLLTSCEISEDASTPTPTPNADFNITCENTVDHEKILKSIGIETIEGESYVAYKIVGAEKDDPFCQMTLYVYTNLSGSIGNLRTYYFFNSNLAMRTYLVTRGKTSDVCDNAWPNSFFVDTDNADCTKTRESVNNGSMTLVGNASI